MSLSRHTGKLAWAVAVLGLLVYEVWALATQHETLSRAMYNMTQAWGLLPFLLGLAIGVLAGHFWWRWDPAHSAKGGG